MVQIGQTVPKKPRPKTHKSVGSVGTLVFSGPQSIIYQLQMLKRVKGLTAFVFGKYWISQNGFGMANGPPKNMTQKSKTGWECWCNSVFWSLGYHLTLADTKNVKGLSMGQFGQCPN